MQHSGKPKAGILHKLLYNENLRSFLAFIVHLIIRFIYLTNRWKVIGSETGMNLFKHHKSFIGCFWHRRLLLMVYAWPFKLPFTMLLSRHVHGLLIAKIISFFGIKSAYGSTKRDGYKGLLHLIQDLKNGICVGITPDGPRGPRQQVSPGIIKLAQMANVPIVPVVYHTTRYRILKSWDRMHIPLPFGRGIILWGEPLYVESDAKSTLPYQDELTRRLNDLEEDAKKILG